MKKAAAHHFSLARVAVALPPLLAMACGGGEQEAKTPIVRERPEDEILRIGKVWESTLEDKGFRTPPSPVSMFSERITSVVTFTPESKTAVESLGYDGTFEAGNATYRCQARADVRVTVLFGRHSGEAAVEMRRPATQVARRCDHPGFPEPVLEVPAAAARFALRGDRLVPFAPATEKRAYLPVP